MKKGRLKKDFQTASSFWEILKLEICFSSMKIEIAFFSN
jgi:hypothetical protein